MQTPIIFIEISVRSQGSIVSANPTRAYRNETIQLSIGEKKIRRKAPFRVFIIFIPLTPFSFYRKCIMLNRSAFLCSFRFISWISKRSTCSHFITTNSCIFFSLNLSCQNQSAFFTSFCIHIIIHPPERHLLISFQSLRSLCVPWLFYFSRLRCPYNLVTAPKEALLHFSSANRTFHKHSPL